MAAVMQQTIGRLATSFEKLTASLLNTAAVLDPDEAPTQVLAALKLEIQQLKNLNESICEDLSSHGASWSEHTTKLQAAQDGKRLVLAHRACLPAVASYIAAASRQLQNMAALSDAAWDESSLQELCLLIWTFTGGSLCGWFDEWACAGLPLLTDDLSVLVPAFAELSTWLLRFSRQSRRPQQVLADSMPAGVPWQGQLFRLLEPLVMHVYSSGLLTDDKSCAALQALPQGCLETLCCLACELFPAWGADSIRGKAATERHDVICKLAIFISKTARAHRKIKSGRNISIELKSVAAIEVVKLAISCVAGEQLAENSNFCQTMLAGLGTMLLRRRTEDTTTSTLALPAAPSHGRDLQAHTSGELNSLVPRTLMANSQLISHLQAVAATGSLFLTPCVVILESLTGTLSDWAPGPMRDNADILASLPSLIHHCLLHLARALPEERFKCVYLAVCQNTTEEIPASLLTPVGPDEMLLLQWLMLRTTVETVRFVCEDPVAARHICFSETQQQDSHQPFMRSSPVWKPFNIFHSIPDRLTLLEMTLRMEGDRNLTSLAFAGCDIAAGHLMIELTCFPQDNPLTDHSSLFTTINKLFQLCMDSTSKHPGLSPSGLSTTGEESVGEDEAHTVYLRLQAAFTSLLIYYTRKKSFSINQYNSVDTSFNSNINQNKRDGSRSRNIITSGAASNRQPMNNEPAGSSTSLAEAKVLRSLASILVLALLRICILWMTRTGGRVTAPQIFAHNSAWMGELLERDPELGAVAHIQLLLLSSEQRASETARKIVYAKEWEEFAVSNFGGRLLPGCCHMGCTNLAGVSEGELPVLACGSCRQAHYCSVACQRAAWRGGGHGLVCRKDM